MTALAKIRLLLALICASLLLTAVVVQKTYTPKNNLEQSAKSLEQGLHKKEAYINSILNNKTRFEGLNTLSNNEQKALKTIDTLTTKERIWLATQINGNLTFWTGIKILPTPALPIKEGRSFIKRANGYFEAIRKTSGNFSVVFFIPVKSNYSFQNKYLQNTFDSGITTDNSLDLADFTDKDVYNVHSIDNQFLFSVKTKLNHTNHNFFLFTSVLWVLNFIFLCLLAHLLCKYLADKGQLILSFIALAAFIIFIRAINLYLHWPGYMSQQGIFSPELYSAGPLFPSLGDFCINMLLVCWLAAFIYRYRHQIAKPVENKALGYFTLIICISILLLILALFVNLFYGLVVTSKINFDVSNVLNLSVYSLIGVLVVCLNFLIFNLIDEVILVIAWHIKIPVLHKIILFVTGVVIITFISSLNNTFTLFYALAGCIIAIRAYVVWYNNGRLEAFSFILIVVLSALIASVKLNSFQAIREHKHRLALINKLENADDKTADLLFKRIDSQIATDRFLLRYYEDSSRNNAYLRMHFKKIYFDGYLSKYDFKIYEFDNAGNALSHDNIFFLDNFKDMVLYSAFKVSKYFYRENDSFGFQSYFAIVPVINNGKSLGTFVVALKSKPLQYTSSFPELLIDGQLDIANPFKGYSYAFYSDNRLISQSGSYTYSLTNKEFKAKPLQYTFTNSP